MKIDFQAIIASVKTFFARLFKKSTPVVVTPAPTPAPVEPPKAPTEPVPVVVATTPAKHTVTTFLEVPTAQFEGHVRPATMIDPIYDVNTSAWYERADCVFVAETPVVQPDPVPVGNVSDDGIRNLDSLSGGQYARFNSAKSGDEREYSFTCRQNSCAFTWGDTSGGYPGGIQHGVTGEITDSVSGEVVQGLPPQGSISGTISYIFQVGKTYKARIKFIDGGAVTVQVQSNG